MRILDCKVPECGELAGRPVTLDYICDGRRQHHDKLKDILSHLKVDYEVNPKLVRGADYYTKTVFEFISNAIGAQGTVCGGGRYNNLVEQIERAFGARRRLRHGAGAPHYGCRGCRALLRRRGKNPFIYIAP